jgi:hypothetical protein
MAAFDAIRERLHRKSHQPRGYRTSFLSGNMFVDAVFNDYSLSIQVVYGIGIDASTEIFFRRKTFFRKDDLSGGLPDGHRVSPMNY